MMNNDGKIRIVITRTVRVRQGRGRNAISPTTQLFAYGVAEAMQEIKEFRENACPDTMPFEKAELFDDAEFLANVRADRWATPFQVVMPPKREVD